MKMYKILAIVTLAVSFTVLSNETVSDDAIFINKNALSTVMKNMAAEGFVGTVSVSSDQQPIYTEGVGEAISGSARYTPTTVVDIASVTKQFTSAAIMTLEQKNLLSTKDTLHKYFPSMTGDKRSITIHQLLTHTAGFKRDLGRDEEAISKDDYIKQALLSPLINKPGKTYHYSNIGYSLLAIIIEAVAGQSYENYLFQALWKPAGMFATGYLRPDWSERDMPRLNKPYAGFFDALEILQKNGENNWHLFGNGGVLSTTEDMMKWYKALMGTAILTSDSREKLFSSYIPEHDAGYFYGYGWSIVPEHQFGKLVWHNGMSFFGKAEYWLFPDSGIAIFVASHAGKVSPWKVANALATAMLTKSHEK